MKPYLLGQYEKSMPDSLTWVEKLTYCKTFGFDYIEMSIDESDEKQKRLDYTTEEKEALHQAMKETGVPIKSICLSGLRKYPFGSHDEQKRSKALEIMEKAVILATDLGIRIIQIPGYDVYYEESDNQTEQWFMENLKVAVKMASLHGVMLGFETMETPFMNTVEKSMKYVSAMQSPYLGVYPDIGNIKNASLLYDTKVSDDIEIGRGHIVAAHFKETLPGIYRELTLGSGHSEFKENASQFYRLGVRLFVGEFWCVGQENWKEICTTSCAFLRDVLNQAMEGENQ